MHRRALLLMGAAFGLAIGPGARARPKISTDTLPGANFAAYKTFGWVNTPMPAGMDPVAYGRIVQDIETGMESKGYVKGSPPDLVLVLSLGAQNKTQINSFGFFGRDLDVYQYTEGKLSIDAFDAKTKRAVWHGQADETIHPDNPDFRRIDSGIARLMQKFPANASAAAAAKP